MPDRRRFLASGAVTASALAARTSLAQPMPIADHTRVSGAPIPEHGYGDPAPAEREVVRHRTRLAPTALSSWSFTPLHQLHGAITPNGLFFERHHAGIPTIDPDHHRLVVHGAVERPMAFSLDALTRFPSVTRTHFIECSGNGGTEWRQPFGKSVAQTHGLLSCAEWTGVAVSTVLQECGLRASARWVIAEGADSAAMNRSIPLHDMLDDAVLVYAQNSEALRPAQGYPLRLLLPGREGNTHIKWLRRLEVSDRPVHSREETSAYTDLLPDGRARQFSLPMGVKSVITRPSPGLRLGVRGFYEIRGLAWSGRGRIRGVEVSVDGGLQWRAARLQGPRQDKCLTLFRFPWRWTGAPTTILSRATDERGGVQPTRTALIEERGLNSVYHYNAIQAWRIDTDGHVHNVHT